VRFQRPYSHCYRPYTAVLVSMLQSSYTRVRIKHARSTGFYDDDEPNTNAIKRSRSESSRCNSDDDEPDNRDYGMNNSGEDFAPDNHPQDDSRHVTDVETALPPIRTDQDAIDEYESSQTATAAEDAQLNTKDRLETRKWVRGKSSIYVDAFNLALDSVLDEESHLFNETEMAVFKYWSELSYEAQYL
jgi:fanconi-associated nuclease 1